MADVKRVATRQSYGEELVALGAERDDFLNGFSLCRA